MVQLYFEDMADGNVYIWDADKLKTVDKMPVGKRYAATNGPKCQEGLYNRLCDRYGVCLRLDNTKKKIKR